VRVSAAALPMPAVPPNDQIAPVPYPDFHYRAPPDPDPDPDPDTLGAPAATSRAQA
jgi:hypothetical protein